MTIKVGINGFGRIGRLACRAMMKNDDFDLKIINCSATTDYMAYQFKYDSVHGRYDGTVEPDGNDFLIIDGKRIAVSHTRNPAEIPFGEYGAEYICESTGAFLTAEQTKGHFAAGAKKVVFSAPAKDDSPTIVMGVNQETTQNTALSTIFE